MEEKEGLEKFNKLFDSGEIKEKKAEAFDKIALMFFNQNFGSANKSEIELQMFSIFMDAMIDHYKNEENVLDYKACSDYEMGKLLGIPQEKVRTLKIKKQARYPQKFDWRESLKTIQNDIVYDSEKKKVIIPMRDPNLYNEIRNFIEENGGYIEIQRGYNCIQIRPKYLFILLYKATDSEKEKETIRKEFTKKLRKHNKDDNIEDILTDRELSERALSYGEDFFEFAKEVADGLSNPLVGIISSIQCLVKVAKKMNRR